MCAEYNVKTSANELNQLLSVSILNRTTDQSAQWDAHVRLYGNAPVLRKREGRTCLEMLRFSFLPPGSRISFTANTRLDDWDQRFDQPLFAYDRPTWRDAFLGRRCIVPLSEFMEPIYWGPHAGQMLGFSSAKDPVLFIAGIWQETVDTKTGEVYSGFSLMTDFALPEVLAAGHHRSVIALSPTAAVQWMQERPVGGPEAVRFLLRNKQPLQLTARSVREMKNWRARVKNAQAKHSAEEEIRGKVLAERRLKGLL
jgi:putative SOS response-associated peptidase YedK